MEELMAMVGIMEEEVGLVEEEVTQVTAVTNYKWTDRDTEALVRWRGRPENDGLFTGKRGAAVKGFEVFLKERGLVGRVEASFIKKKWENLKQKYKELKAPPTGVSTEGGEATAATWRWFDLMDEVIGHWPCITPVSLVSSSMRSIPAPPPIAQSGTAGVPATPHPPAALTPALTAARPAPPARPADPQDQQVPNMKKRKREAEWERFLADFQEKEAERDQEEQKREREAEAARLEREEKKEKERKEEERKYQEQRDKEFREWMEAREEKEKKEREERERLAGAREDRFMALLQALIKEK